MNLGQTIYELRTAKNLSQGDLSDLLDVSRQSVSKWENNTATPDLDKLIKLCDIFDISLDELTGRTKPEPKQTSVETTVFPVRNSALTQQKIIGYILLVISLLSALVFIILGSEPYMYLITVLPALVCSLLCLLVKNKAGYWCIWAVYQATEFFSVFSVGYNVYRATRTLRIFCVIVMFFVACFLFKEITVSVTQKRGIGLLLGWIMYIVISTGALWLVFNAHLSERLLHTGIQMYLCYIVNIPLTIFLAFLVTYSACFVRNWYLQKHKAKASQ